MILGDMDQVSESPCIGPEVKLSVQDWHTISKASQTLLPEFSSLAITVALFSSSGDILACDLVHTSSCDK